MRYISFFSAFSIFAFGSQLPPAKSTTGNGTPVENSTGKSISVIDKALKECEQLATMQEKFQVLQSGATKLLAQVQSNVLIKNSLQDVLEEQHNKSSADSVARLKSALREAREILSFEPVMEAPLPAGFPKPTPVGAIQIKSYPAYRLAKTDSTGRGNNAFFTLFRHIKSKKIAMTAPVEMTYGKDAKNQQRSMAFLYRSRDLGQVGKSGGVEVVDVPASMVASLGLRGYIDGDRLKEARRHLQSWLKEHADRYETAGPLRVMGYNSPFVVGNRRFSEVQIPIRLKKSNN